MADQAQPEDNVSIPVTEAMRSELQDALYLMDFAINTGLKKPDGRSVSAEIVSVIMAPTAKVGPPDSKADGVSIKASDWARFELGYYALADFTSPVTAETLRNTTTGHGIVGASPAQKFARLLWVLAGFFSAAVLIAGYIMQRPEADNDTPDTFLQLAKLCTPWAYGGLGACAYLLRSAHVFIYQRSFDVRRKPEYLNRILLGAISGGAVIVLVNQLTDQGGTQINVSSAALGFIAGYNTDFLFNTVERVVAAIFPKVGPENVQRATPTSAKPAAPPKPK